MESNWRTNIAVLGLVGYRYSMCARVLSGGQGYEYVGRIAEPSLAYNLFTLVPGPNEELWVFFSIRAKVGHFPYGLEVEED